MSGKANQIPPLRWPSQKIPESHCPMGYTSSQIVNMMGGQTLRAWERWSRELGPMVCDGLTWDGNVRTERPSRCANNPHGAVYPLEDVERFLRNKPAQVA